MPLISLIHTLTLPCADNGRRFTRTERCDKIRQLLEPTDFVPLGTKPLAFVYRHKAFDAARPFTLVSAHVDSLYENYHSSECGDELHGTYDNAICNAVLVHLMIEGKLPSQTVVAFTGDEERESRGVDQTLALLQSLKLLPTLRFVVVLDVTEEGYPNHAYTLENLFCGDDSVCSFAFPSSPALESRLRAWIASSQAKVLPETDYPDETWQYDEHDLPCCALCLPIQPFTDDMHDEEGVRARRSSPSGYAAALTRLLHGIATTDNAPA